MAIVENVHFYRTRVTRAFQSSEDMSPCSGSGVKCSSSWWLYLLFEEQWRNKSVINIFHKG